MSKNKFTVKKNTCDTEKREAQSDEHKQIYNEKVTLAKQKKRETESDEQKQIHNEKKRLATQKKTVGRV